MDDCYALVWKLDDSLEWESYDSMVKTPIARRVIAWREGDRLVPLIKGRPIAADDPFYSEAVRQIKEAAPGDMSWVV